jgi:hypothetical protein
VEYSDDAAGFVFCAVIFHASSFSYQNDFMMAEGRFSASGKREGSDTAGGCPGAFDPCTYREAFRLSRRRGRLICGTFHACAEGFSGTPLAH